MWACSRRLIGGQSWSEASRRWRDTRMQKSPKSDPYLSLQMQIPSLVLIFICVAAAYDPGSTPSPTPSPSPSSNGGGGNPGGSGHGTSEQPNIVYGTISPGALAFFIILGLFFSSLFIWCFYTLVASCVQNPKSDEESTLLLRPQFSASDKSIKMELTNEARISTH